LRHSLIVKKNSKGKGKKCKKEKAALKKTKVKGREVHKKKGKAAPEKQFRSVRILCIPLQSCIVACLN